MATTGAETVPREETTLAKKPPSQSSPVKDLGPKAKLMDFENALENSFYNNDEQVLPPCEELEK